MTKAETLESRGNVFTPFTGCAQIYYQRWYVRPSGTSAEGIVCLATANRGNDYSPTGVPPYPLVYFAYRHTPKCGACLSTKFKMCHPKGG